MVSFGGHIEKDPQARVTEEMKRLSLELAHSIRKAVAPAFDVQATDLSELRGKPRSQQNNSGCQPNQVKRNYGVTDHLDSGESQRFVVSNFEQSVSQTLSGCGWLSVLRHSIPAATAKAAATRHLRTRGRRPLRMPGHRARVRAPRAASATALGIQTRPWAPRSWRGCTAVRSRPAIEAGDLAEQHHHAPHRALALELEQARY